MIRASRPAMLAGALAAGIFTALCQLVADHVTATLSARAEADSLYLHFTTPAYNAVPSGCSAALTPADDLATTELWVIWAGWQDTLLLKSHAAAAPGAQDSFVIPRLTQVLRCMVATVDLAGNRTCMSNPYDPWAATAVPYPSPPLPIAPLTRMLYDIAGRKIVGRPLPGIYFERIGRARAVRVVVIR